MFFSILDPLSSTLFKYSTCVIVSSSQDEQSDFRRKQETNYAVSCNGCKLVNFVFNPHIFKLRTETSRMHSWWYIYPYSFNKNPNKCWQHVTWYLRGHLEHFVNFGSGRRTSAFNLSTSIKTSQHAQQHTDPHTNGLLHAQIFHTCRQIHKILRTKMMIKSFYCFNTARFSNNLKAQQCSSQF